MQTTELDPTLSQTLDAAGKAGLKLVIGNKNYSSWSMRPWVAMKAFGIPFEEVRIGLDRPDTGSRIAQYSLAGRVPVLIDGETSVWDSLAICEYLAEQFPDKAWWPRDVASRAMARSMCAEMHSGFTGLRSAMWMNIRANFPGKGRTTEAQADIGRISEIWETCLTRSGPHRFLFGDFSIVDAYFAPVVMRFRTYGVALAPALQAYVNRVIAHPAVAQWMREAEAEGERFEKYDVYPD
ncbi:glutathione S-transferase family protein [Noviherbaspirillum cavernae]|uniref:Glutathione S-transferase family protein n=1 Tax=Noviherbaspirillum cavernae TaxID=2320862 RepID=A0A418WXJ9_9BURK|nr:glutathione S-transferase family protein [Noviherbaspirillum cavernae]RJG04932.1 glutathione S-transferase family protein [Noviherbaspirillum cavernae]